MKKAGPLLAMGAVLAGLWFVATRAKAAQPGTNPAVTSDFERLSQADPQSAQTVGSMLNVAAGVFPPDQYATVSQQLRAQGYINLADALNARAKQLYG